MEEEQKTKSHYMNYTILQTLGSGAQGKVKLALDGENKFALKFLKQNCDISKELEIHRRLKHENIVPLLQYHHAGVYTKKDGSEQIRSCLVYEYQEGGELFEYIAQMGRFREDICRFFLYLMNLISQQLLQAVYYMHERGVTHRDLKPENILFSGSILRVTDLGFVTYLGGHDGVLSTFKGTKGYMAPEIMAKQTYNGQSVDIFSCGVILYVMATGQLPFATSSYKDPLYNLICTNRQQTFWNSKEKALGFSLSQELKLLITAMIAFDPLQRPTISEILMHPWYNMNIAPTDSEAVCALLQQRQRKIHAQQEKQKLMKEQQKANGNQNICINLNSKQVTCGIGKFNRGENEQINTNKRVLKSRTVKFQIDIDEEYLFQQLISYGEITNNICQVSDVAYQVHILIIQFNYRLIDADNQEFEMKISLVKCNSKIGVDYQLVKGDRLIFFQKQQMIEDFILTI